MKLIKWLLFNCWLTMLLGAAGPPAVWAQWVETSKTAYRFDPPNAPVKPFHAARYRGTVGKRWVTVVLKARKSSYEDSATTISGTVRFDGSPTVLHWLRPWCIYHPAATLRLVETDSTRPHPAVGFWQTDQPAGSFLTGTWTGPADEKRHFELREDYRDEWGKLAAVPYETVSNEYVVVHNHILSAAEFRSQPLKGTGESDSLMVVGIYYQSCLHLLGPDTLRPSIAKIQCPPPAMRNEWARQRATEKLKYITNEKRQGRFREYRSTEDETSNVSVLYANHGLLCWAEGNSYCSGQMACHHSNSQTVYDLNTGDTLHLRDILRPGAGVDKALRRSVARHLRADDQYTSDEDFDYSNEQGLAPLPANNTFGVAEFGIVEKGLVFHYADGELMGFRWGPEIMLPWAEVLPLLRSDSPVARMLRERGLWQANPRPHRGIRPRQLNKRP